MLYRAELDYSLKDMRQFDKLHQRFRIRWAYIVRRIEFFIALLMLAGAGGLLLWYRVTNTVILRVYGAVVIFFALWFALNEFRLFSALKTIRAHGVIMLTADDSCIHTEAENLTTQISYQGICDIVHCKETFYLYIDKRNAQILPERCFTEGDPAAFGAFIEQKTGLKIKEFK